MEKWLGWGSIGLSGLLLILFVLDFLAGVPFGGRWKHVDIIGILACALVVYMSFDVLKDLGFPGLSFGKSDQKTKKPSTDAVADSFAGMKAFLQAAEVGQKAKSGKEARRAMQHIITILDKEGKDFAPGKKLAADLKPTLPTLKKMKDDEAIEMCHDVAGRLIAAVKEHEESVTKVHSRSS
jgi:hypothetical protein